MITNISFHDTLRISSTTKKTYTLDNGLGGGVGLLGALGDGYTNRISNRSIQNSQSLLLP